MQKFLNQLIRWFGLLTLVVVAGYQAGTSSDPPGKIVPKWNPNGDLLSELMYTNLPLNRDEVLWRFNLRSITYDSDSDFDDESELTIWSALESDALWLTDYPRESLSFNFGMGFFDSSESLCDNLKDPDFKTRCNYLAQRWKAASFSGFNDIDNEVKIIFKKEDYESVESKPYGVGLLNMHALIKWFDEKYPLSPASENTVRVAVVDTQKLFPPKPESGPDYSSSPHYPQFEGFVDSNASYKEPPGHSFQVSQVLFGPISHNTPPSSASPFIVGAVRSSTHILGQAFVRDELPKASYLRPPTEQPASSHWILPVQNKQSASKAIMKVLYPEQIIYLLGASTAVIGRERKNGQLDSCGWHTNCINLDSPVNDENLEKISQWQINRDPDSKAYRIPAAPQLVNLSMGKYISRSEVEDNPEEGDKKYLSCGGKGYESLYKESGLITIVAHENYRKSIAKNALNCPYNIGVAGYDMYTNSHSYTGHAPIAESHDLRIFEGNLGESLSSPLRTVSVPYGRYMHDYPIINGETDYKASNPFSWELQFVTGNSFSAPLVTGVIAEMMLRWPKSSIAEFDQQKIYDLLNYGSWRRAYPVNKRGIKVGAADSGVPIINIPCAMASVLVANLQARGITNASIGTIYSELGPEKARSIFVRGCAHPYNPMPQ